MNGNRFLDFRITAEPGQPMQELRVKAAVLWLKADFRKRSLTACQQYLWAFRVKETPNYSNKLRIEEVSHSFYLSIIEAIHHVCG